jgi:hypothetical protein
MVLARIIILLYFITFIISDDFVNVQVLDITSRTQMKKYMKSISKDLGVKCSYCHDMDDKSLDTPDKEIAREMIILTRQINDYLKSLSTKEDTTVVTISCWTCHKGKPEVEKNRPEED